MPYREHFMQHDDEIFFSIIVVSLNAEATISNTIQSILNQSFENYEIVVKDGLSSDNTVKTIPKSNKIKLVCMKDHGIYDAMNQAFHYCEGRYLFFLNCGDSFFDERLLQMAYDYLNSNDNCCLFGDYYNVSRGSYVLQNYLLSDYFWYRTTICHQSIFVPRSLLKKEPFDSSMRIAADFKLLFALFNDGVLFLHKDFVVSKYDGNGMSASKSGKKKNKQEKRIVLKSSFSQGKRFFFFIKKVFSKIVRKRFY